MRITIVGLPACGKSTLARAIARKLHIPHIHIDRFWLEAGGRQGSHDTPDIDQVRARVRERTLAAIRAESWISDGFYPRVQREIAQRADILIFLDIPLWRRMLNHAVRILSRSERHREVGLWDDIRFFGEIVRRNFTSAPKLKMFLKEFKDKTVILKSRNEINMYLQNLT